MNIGKILNSESPVPVQDISEIEDLIFSTKNLNDKIQHLKNLKKKRASIIDEQIKKLEGQKEKIEGSILQSLKVFQKKSVDFPGIGKVTSRNVKGGIQIIDEDKLILELENKYSNDQLKNVIVQSSEKNIAKKQLNNFLQSHQISEEINNFVVRQNDSASLSISFDKNINDFKDAYIGYSQVADVNETNYDGL